MITIDLSGDAGALLPGETVLWTGRPAAVRIVPAEALLALAYSAAVIVAILWWSASLREAATLIDAAVSIVAPLVILQGVSYAAGAFVTWPRTRSRELYQVTNWRVLVIAGQAERPAGARTSISSLCRPSGRGKTALPTSS